MIDAATRGRGQDNDGVWNEKAHVGRALSLLSVQKVEVDGKRLTDWVNHRHEWDEQVNKWWGSSRKTRLQAQVAMGSGERGDRGSGLWIVVEEAAQQPLSWCFSSKDMREKVLLHAEQLYFLTSEWVCR